MRWSRHDGIDVAIKVAAGTRRSGLRREAEVLARLEGLRVPRLVELLEAPDHVEMVMQRHGALTLADTPLLDPGERRAALLGLCAALDELHEAGWVHGRIEARHVLVGERGRVRLCSLAEAKELVGSGSDAIARDLSDLCAVVLEVLDAEAAFQGALARWRWNRAARGLRRRIAGTRGLVPPAAMGEMCRAALPSKHGRSSRGRLGRSATIVLVVAVVAAVGALGALVHRGSEAQGQGRDVARPTAPLDTAPADAEPPDQKALPNPIATGPSSRPGDGTLVVDGVDYKVAEPGDVVVLGDWNCDGVATPAVFRPSTGSVFGYDTWASADSPATAHTLGRAPGAAGIRAAEACGAPRVEWPDGTLTPLEEIP
jgi:hypothetical protein